MLVLDAALSGAKGVNLWASFRNPPQRSTRLYRALVEKGLASSVFGAALLPTEEPFLYTVTCTVSDGTHRVGGGGGRRALSGVRAEGITPAEFDARGTSFARGWCLSPTASPTSRIRSGTSTHLATWTSITASSGDWRR